MIKVIEVDLAGQLADLYIDHRYHKVTFVARWGYTPLGLVQMSAMEGQRFIGRNTLKTLILNQLGWSLWENKVAGMLDSIGRASRAELSPITVAVCTRDRPGSLKACLEALARLDYPDYEVLVVDNASHDPAVRQVVETTGFRYVREEIPGLNWARNRAQREARHDIVAYIDDDVIASPGWLLGIAHGFSEPETMAVTGLVLPAELETPAQNAFEVYGGMSKGFSSRVFRRDDLDPAGILWSSSWGIGANMAFRRDLFELVGGFDPVLDVGTPTRGGGDIEFFHRVVAAGHTLRYDPAAYVYHVHRRDGSALMRQIGNNGRSFPAYLLTVAHNHRDQRGTVISFALRQWLWGWLVKRGIKAIWRRDWQTTSFVAAELRGSLGAIQGYRESRRAVAKRETNNPKIDDIPGRNGRDGNRVCMGG
jgi:glycosyltransferase involved in cell wall biosynthesis